MNIALIGYGKMGREIERIALRRGHVISCIINIENKFDFDSDAFKNSDVAIEFTGPDSAVKNIKKCFAQRMPIVAGSTGWMNQFEAIRQEALASGQTFFYASNYSIGVNLFFEMNKSLAQLMGVYPKYKAKIEEIHHIHKLDAPSGTAISIAQQIISQHSQYQSWTMERPNENDLPVSSFREGEVSGTHHVMYESDEDVIQLSHIAKNRIGFAYGAVLAAEFIYQKQGVFGMPDLLKF